MRGGTRYKKHKVLPDPKYQSVDVSKFINQLMQDGKKDVAKRVCYAAFEVVETHMKQPPLDVFRKALENVAPLLEVRSRRIGGATYQVPREVRADRKMALAMRWLVGAARNRQGKPVAERLARELQEAYEGTGSAMKKREELHKMAEANRAFAHFARF